MTPFKKVKHWNVRLVKEVDGSYETWWLSNVTFEPGGISGVRKHELEDPVTMFIPYSSIYRMEELQFEQGGHNG
jgi:hypothetical protein